MVLGASRRSRLVTLIAGKSIPTKLARRAEGIDVHLVSRAGPADRGPALTRILMMFRPSRVQPARDRAEAAALTRLAGCVLRGHGDLPTLIEEMRRMFGLDAVSLLEWRQNGAGPACYVVASAGERPPEGPGADVELPVSDTFTLAGRGRGLGQEDLRMLSSCAVLIMAGIRGQRQEELDAQAAGHGAELRSRAALLAATGRSAREQLSAAQAALAALTECDSPGDRMALLARARGAVDAVSRLVDDLRDLSRLHAGEVETYLRPVDLDEVVAASLDDLGPGGQHVMLSMAEDLPDVIADAALLTRTLTSLLADALARSPAGLSPVLTAAGLTSLVEIRIADQGPDQGEDPVNLALRLARDLTDAMGGTLCREQNPGRGRTVILTLPTAARQLPAGHTSDVGSVTSR